MISESTFDDPERSDVSVDAVFADVDATLVSMQEVIGRKWHPVILYHLYEDGPMGFSSLKEQIDEVSSKMLSESLDGLEASGLLTRTLLSDRPVRVEYEVTDAGQALRPVISEMIEWGIDHGLATEVDGENGDRGTTDGRTDRVGTPTRDPARSTGVE